MTPEEAQSVAYHVRELAKLLYKDADPKRLTNLGDLEAVVREQVHKYVTPALGVFYPNRYRHPRRLRAAPQKHFRRLETDQ